MRPYNVTVVLIALLVTVVIVGGSGSSLVDKLLAQDSLYHYTYRYYSWEACNPDGSIQIKSFQLCPGPMFFHSTPLKLYSVGTPSSLNFELELLDSPQLYYQIDFHPITPQAREAVHDAMVQNDQLRDEFRFRVVTHAPTVNSEAWKVTGDAKFIEDFLRDAFKDNVPTRQLFIQLQDEHTKLDRKLFTWLTELGFDGSYTGLTPEGNSAITLVRRRDEIINCTTYAKFPLAKVYQWQNEIELMDSNLEKGYKMLEWGSGGSTLYYSKKVNAYYSIEHNLEWYYNVICESPPRVDQEGEWVHMALVQSDLPWEWPANTLWNNNTIEGTREMFLNYVLQCKRFGVRRFDAVLVDGRARAECAIEVLDIIDSNSKVFVHDWERASYRELVNKGYRAVKQAGRMALLSKKLEPSKVV